MDDVLSIGVTAELNDSCSAVTLTFRDVPLGRLADVMTAIGSPLLVQEYVEGVNAQIPIKRAGGPETRKTIRVESHARKGD